MKAKQPKDYVPMNTGQRLVVGVCLVIAGLMISAWAIVKLVELTP